MNRLNAMLTSLLCLVAALAVQQVQAQTTKVEYIHTDALGTPVAVTDATGAVIERSEYEPYGQLANRALTDGPGFTGHVQDAATGLTYMQQRYYDPVIGRFLSVDPVTAYSTSGANFNRYWYANNNPYRFTDPDGRWSRDFEVISKQAGTYLKTPPRSDKDWLGPVIGVSLAAVSAPALGFGAWELGMVALANPATTTTIAMGLGEAAGVTGAIRYGPINPGPLSRDVANTFRSASYTARTLESNTTLYRVISDKGNPAGSFWTSIKPQGPLQSVIDSALDQNWGNAATRVITADVPAGTRIYEGAAAAQRGLVGGGNQIYIPKVDPKWIRDE